MLYVWLIILVLSVIIEALTTSLLVIWFGVGAIMAMVCNSLGLGIPAQVTVFVITSFVLLFIFIKKIKRKMFKTEKTNLDVVIGAVCMVDETIPEHGNGRVKVNSQSWNAKEKDGKKIEKGEFVKVLEIQGVTLLCEKTKKEAPGCQQPLV